MRYVFLVLALLLSTACTTAPPRNPGDICAIFREKDDWYDDASEASKRWDSPIPVMMSIMYQESRFVADAKPPRKYWLGFIPAGRMSDAYGYPQAKDATWDWYKDKSGNWGADRDDFEDAIDFIGWDNNVSRRTNGIANTDTYSCIWLTMRATAVLNAGPSPASPGYSVLPAKCRRARAATLRSWHVAKRTLK